ncbi:MAG: tRNA (N6-isopentenyl adenosine(37)-C2)-methylthiotransferase MiaB [Rickettsia sp.]|nr:tRNA (N6-isopentenyl adenosine(37)-C2)-methylthiotransferase MiaB [Rickettsia sp.]
MKVENKFFIKTYGCQMNIYDSSKMAEILLNMQYKESDNMQDANLIILNTCHIREKAAEKIYSDLGRIRKIDSQKNKILIVAGCVAQAEGEAIFERAPYVDIIVGPQSYHDLENLLNKIKNEKVKNIMSLDFTDEEKFDKLPNIISKKQISSFVSVQEGCDKFCHFCVVPYTRGPEFSRKVEEVFRESLSLVSNGSKEIYLVGQNVNAYHGLSSDEDEFSLAKLIEHISKIKSLKRIRYTTSHPIDLTEDLIKLHGSNSKLMPMLHLPVQSGSNKILKKMNRKHSREEYIEKIRELKKYCPHIALSSDFIVGFPEETEEDFNQTLSLVREINFAQSYSFKYSPRPGTPASLKKQIPEEIKSKRLRILQDILSQQSLEFNNNFIGQKILVLFDKKGKFSNQILGKTPFLQSLYIEHSDETILGQILEVKVTAASYNSLKGVLV